MSLCTLLHAAADSADADTHSPKKRRQMRDRPLRSGSSELLMWWQRLLLPFCLFRVVVESCLSASFSSRGTGFTSQPFSICVRVDGHTCFLFDGNRKSVSPLLVMKECCWFFEQDAGAGGQEGDDEGDASAVVAAAAAAAAGSSEAITDFVVVISIPFCQGRADRFHLNA